MLKRFSLSIIVLMMLCFSCKQNNDSAQKVNEGSRVNSIDTNQYLKLVVNDYIEEKVRYSIENETKYFSLAPFKMFYRSFFSSREEREDNWINTFNANGLNRAELENYINQQITAYNKQNSQLPPLPKIKLTQIKKNVIIDDKAFEVLNTMEFNVWFQNIWFDYLLMISFMLIIGLIVNLFFSIEVDNIISTIGIKIVIGGMFFLLFFTFNEIRAESIHHISTNYSKYITNQIINAKNNTNERN